MSGLGTDSDGESGSDSGDGGAKCRRVSLPDARVDQPKKHATAQPLRTPGNLRTWFDAMIVCLRHAGIR